MGLLTTSSSPNQTCPPNTTGLPPHLQKAVAKVTEISSLPEITNKIVEVVEDPRATAHDMHEIVKNDPALAAKILKVVNSAFYGLPAQIASLDRAIVMLGLSAVKNIALAASLARLFKPGALSERFEARDLWRHCVGVGVCARMLTKAANGVQNDEAFVAGLVHDMGLLVEYQIFPEQLRDVINRVQSRGEDFCTVERELIGADHQAFGAALSMKWKFPPLLRCVISHHHNPEPLKPEFKKAVAIIYLADHICCQQQFGFWLSCAEQPATDQYHELIGLSPEHIENVIENLPEQIEAAEQVFGEL